MEASDERVHRNFTEPVSGLSGNEYETRGFSTPIWYEKRLLGDDIDGVIVCLTTHEFAPTSRVVDPAGQAMGAVAPSIAT